MNENQDVQLADIGLIGLAVMGENLALNIEKNGFHVALYNRTPQKVDKFLQTRGLNKKFIGSRTVEELCLSVARPRKLIIMVKAGNPVDDFIDQILPYLDENDILIDGGNSHYLDTIRRTKYVNKEGVFFIGAGISGGEEGALNGPSIMPGGNQEAWSVVKPILQSISAKVDGNVSCCEWVGNDGSGHYVKMVHNGIEYSDMQLICEAYQLLSSGLDLPPNEMHDIFKSWNSGPLNSYLIEITSDILKHRDKKTGKFTIDIILDVAGQKGTGKWTAVSGLELGTPIPQIAQAVFARCLSVLKVEREHAATVLSGPNQKIPEPDAFIDKLMNALYAAKICSYAQGFQLLKFAADEFNWDLNFGDVALLWRGGCIIRAGFLKNIKEAFDKEPGLNNLLLDSYFSNIMINTQNDLRHVVKQAIDCGIPLPSMTSALNYYDAYRCTRLPANLLQAQRDYFGAHTYERIDAARGEFFHTNWTGQGGETASSSYTV